MGKKSGLIPGEKAPASGQYQEIGPRGGAGREVTSIKGKRLPPSTRDWQHIQARRPQQEQIGTWKVIGVK